MRVTRGSMRRRLVLALMALLAAIGGLIGRLSYMQIVQAPWLAGEAEAEWSRSITLQGIRGSILDSSGDQASLYGQCPIPHGSAAADSRTNAGQRRRSPES